jgi:hypothetical protein
MAEFRFSQPENLAVFVCENVLRRGKPILHVSHDQEGDWQFLCGGTHDEDDDDPAAIVCLSHVVALDASLNELADLGEDYEAWRDTSQAPWRIHDRTEDAVHEDVREHGCHVMKICADDEGPGFAYSIGLTKNYGQPELICFGLDMALMHHMINAIRDRMAAGTKFHDGQRVSELIEGYDCELRTMKTAFYRDFLGYARWFYDGDEFEAFQIVWPDKAHCYPWDTAYAGSARQQPRTW